MNRQLQFLGLPAKTKGDVDLKKHLFDHGIGVIEAVKTIQNQRSWVLDSVTYLSKNGAVSGLLCRVKDKIWNSVRLGAVCVWCTSMGTREENAYDTIDKCLECEKCFVVWKMWYPVARGLQFGSGDLILTSTAMTDTQRLEMEKTSAYMPIVNDYKDSKACVFSQMKKWRTPVLMSNDTSVVLCRPTRNGFRGEKLMTVECLNKFRQSERLFETFVKKVQIIAEQRPEQKVKIYNVAAHALHSACRILSIPIKSNDFSIFSEEELKMILEYDKNIQANVKTIEKSEKRLEEAAKIEEEKQMQKFASPPPTQNRPPVARLPHEPRNPMLLAKEREARKARLRKLQQTVQTEDEVVTENSAGQISSLMLL